MNNHDFHPTAYVRKLTVYLNEDYCTKIDGFLRKVVYGISQQGYPFLGHLKMAVIDSLGNVFYISVVDQETGCQFQGELTIIDKPVDIKINAILYGVDKNILQKIIENELESIFSKQEVFYGN